MNLIFEIPMELHRNSILAIEDYLKFDVELASLAW